MAENGVEQPKNVWPLPKFYFRVTWGDKEMQFQEVSGLDVQAEEINDRSGSRPAISAIKMPNLIKFGSVTMKKGIIKGDNDFRKWYEKIKMNTIDRQTVIISLLDEAGASTMAWELTNAWPTKITATDLKSDGELAIEMVEIAYEGVKIIKS